MSGMKMARPPKEQIEAVMDFMGLLEGIIELREYPGGAKVRDKHLAFECIQSEWRKVSSCWQRVLWAGKTCIDNACDSNASSLEYKPEIQAAMDAAKRDTERGGVLVVCPCCKLNRSATPCPQCQGAGVILVQRANETT